MIIVLALALLATASTAQVRALTVSYRSAAHGRSIAVS
jgi:hypothetical protein